MTPPEIPPLNRNIPQRRSLLGKGSMPFPELVHKTSKNVIDPASIPLPDPDELENVSLNQQNGSEDLIIHDSEEEEVLSPVSGGNDKSTALDWTKFVYAR
jgi:exonuclease 1